MPRETFYLVSAGNRDDGGHQGEAQECRRLSSARLPDPRRRPEVLAIDATALLLVRTSDANQRPWRLRLAEESACPIAVACRTGGCRPPLS
jgi:hypothetical protein